MCFSLKASLVSSFLLFTISYFCIKKNKNTNKWALSLIPFFFAIQQLVEAGVWLTFDYDLNIKLRLLFSYLFLLFAFIIWPIWMPFSFLKLETNKLKHKILKILFFFGLILASYLTVNFFINSLTVKVDCNHIVYDIIVINNLNDFVKILIYFVPTITPFFISSFKKAKFFGLLATVSLVVTYLFFKYAATSVWCFFCALFSCLVYFII